MSAFQGEGGASYTKTFTQESISRFKTLFFNVFYVAILGAIDALGERLGSFDLSDTEVLVAGLILAQISKLVRNKMAGEW